MTPPEMQWLAHSAGALGTAQTQQEHLSNVVARAVDRCPPFLVNDTRLAGWFHDFGKYSELFLKRLRGEVSGLDHWTPGAHLLRSQKMSDLATAAVHAHHVGLGPWSKVSQLGDNLTSLEGRTLTLSTREELNEALQAMLDDGFQLRDCAPGRRLRGTVGSMLDARMVLSALVDADYSDTAHHMRGTIRPVAPDLNADAAFERLKLHVATLGSGASASVRAVRTDLWDASQTAALLPPGLFELEAPTGSGKTLAMLGFALRHMAANRGKGLRRIIVALPFLSILDQTVDAYRAALGEQAVCVLEHHSLAEWRQKAEEDGDEERRRAAEALSEDWESPIIVTTNVQLLESLFTKHPGTSRKLCALSRAVILLDEAQTIHQKLIVPTLRAISRLCHSDFGSTVVVATATQPLFSRFAASVERESENVGWAPAPLAQSQLNLYARTVRYGVDWSRCELDAPLTWDEISRELVREERVLCIVNTKKDARLLTELVVGRMRQSGCNRPVEHLSTNLCAAHRRHVLGRRYIQEPQRPCVVISTQCVEAGVDLDFPVVYRAVAPLDSIAQAAGRCNRNGRSMGSVRVFLPKDARYPGKMYDQGAQETLTLLKEFGDLDPQDPRMFDLYFNRIYDLATHAGTSREMEKAIEVADFPEVDRLYRLIEHRDVVHIVVPYPGAPPSPFRPTTEFFRAAQPYVVDAYRKEALKSPWLGSPLKGTDDWYVLSDSTAYDCRRFGLRLDHELPIC